MSWVRYEGYTRQEALDSVGKGWSHLVNRVFDFLDALGHPIKIIQVKEKFAGLRIYTDYSHPAVEQLISDMEDASYKTCEACGAPGVVRNAPWLFTACDEHSGGVAAMPDSINPFI